jgi:hypothetical protein
MAFSAALLNAVRTARQVAGVPIVYRRGATGVELTAIVGATPYDREDRAGVIVRSQVRDYLIAAADLDLGDGPTTPQRGDRIEQTTDGQTWTYEVMPIGDEAPWRYSGPGRDVYRVHTRLIDQP